MTVRPLRTAAIAALGFSLTVLAACSSDGGEKAASASEEPTGAYPVTIESAFGPVTIEKKPQKVVALGWGDAETALSLGTQPVGASDWLNFGGDGVGPWLADAYSDKPTLIETLEPSFEAIGALEPDLILDVRSSGDKARHDRLAQIATTVGIPAGAENYTTSSETQLEIIAQALGVPEKGKEVQQRVDDAFAAAAAEHPEWKGKTVAAATRTSEGWGAYTKADARVNFLTKLGFDQSPQVAALKPDESGFSIALSSEQLGQLDADLVVAFPIFIKADQITGNAQWKAIPAVKDGRSVVIDGDLASAYSLGTSDATLFALKEITPKIAAALKE